MSTSRKIDRICITAIALALIGAILMLVFAYASPKATGKVMGYEDRLFSTDKVHSIDLVVKDWDEFITTCENEEYTSCTVAIDGEKYTNIGLRAKGNTSLSSVSSMGSQRYSFKLEFDQYRQGGSYYGLDKFCLNNLIQDNTMMKDYLAYQLMADFGVDTPLCSYAYITVNGEDWGLYLAVEAVEDGFLQRNYGADAGNMYKPDSLSFGGGRGNGKDFDMGDFDFSNVDMGDFDPADMGDFEPGDFSFSPGNMPDMSQIPDRPDGEEAPQSQDGQSDPPTGETGGSEKTDSSRGEFNFGGMGGGMGSDDVKLKYIDDDPDSYSNIFNSAKTDITKEDKERLIASLKSLSSYEDLEQVLDTDEVLRYFVVHNFLCNGDSYTGSMIHNYYLHEQGGQLSMIPWDYNLAFGTFQGGNASDSVNADIDNPVSGDADDRPMVGWIFSDEAYTEQYHELFDDFIDRWFTDGKLEQMIRDTAELIAPYVEKDPTKFCTVEEFEAGVEVMVQFVDLRAQSVALQLEGSTQTVDCGELNLSDMGSMGSTGMGGGKR